MSNDGQQRANLDAARRMSHGEQLARVARKHPDRIAYKFREEIRSFAALDDRVNRLANALADRGVGRGDRVSTLTMNCIEMVETYFATARLGAICVPINFRLVAEEIIYIAHDSGAKALVVDENLAQTAGLVRGRLGTLESCLVIGSDVTSAGPGAESYEEALAHASDRSNGVDVNEHESWFIMYTSGTTGRPKGAVLSHFNLLMNTITMQLTMGISGDDEVWLSGLPLFHIGGLNGILPYIALAGTSVILPSGQFDATEVVDLLEREQITGCYFVPTQWQAICDVADITKRKLALRRISWGASVAPPSVLQSMAETFPGIPNYNAFGQTEMSSITCVLRGEDAISKMGSVGKPVPTVEAMIVDDDVREVPQGEIGEIVYRGPTVLQEYWNKPEATAEAFDGGWFHSGDLCRMDEDGFIFVVDRKKDMIISGGENIYCAEVEAVIDAHPKVKEVALIGLPHDKWVETPCAVVVPADPADPPTQQEIIDWCRTRLASYKKPTSIVLSEGLPRNASGKVLKITLRAEHTAPDR
ncbi:MAG: fatty-acid--CoA ligase FadD5 [Acidimicrobiales bacterium]